MRAPLTNRIADGGIVGPHIADDKLVYPLITEVVGVVDDRGIWRYDVSQARAIRDLARYCFPVLVDRQTIGRAANAKFSEVIIQPAHGDLDGIMQDLEGDRGRDLDQAPDQWIAVFEVDTERGNLGEAVDSAFGGQAARNSRP